MQLENLIANNTYQMGADFFHNYSLDTKEFNSAKKIPSQTDSNKCNDTYQMGVDSLHIKKILNWILKIPS